MQYPLELTTHIGNLHWPIQYTSNSSSHRATSLVQPHTHHNQRSNSDSNSNVSYNRTQNRSRANSSGRTIRRDKHYYLPDDMRFSFQAKPITQLEKGAGPWGPTDWYDSNGRLPVSFGYTSDDWRLFWHIHSNIHMNTLSLSQYNCYIAMMAERRRWRTANAEQLHNSFIRT